MAKQGVNKVVLIGNIGSDPELRYFNDGNGVCNVSLATSESWNDKQTGEKKERTEWHRCVFMDRGNYKMAQYAGEMHKGEKLYVEGHLQTRKWQDSNGQDRYSTEIRVDEFQRLSPRDQGAGQGAPGSAPPQQQQAPAPQSQQYGSAPPQQTGAAPPPQGQPQGAHQHQPAPQQNPSGQHQQNPNYQPQGQPAQTGPTQTQQYDNFESQDIPF